MPNGFGIWDMGFGRMEAVARRWSDPALWSAPDQAPYAPMTQPPDPKSQIPNPFLAGWREPATAHTAVATREDCS